MRKGTTNLSMDESRKAWQRVDRTIRREISEHLRYGMVTRRVSNRLWEQLLYPVETQIDTQVFELIGGHIEGNHD